MAITLVFILWIFLGIWLSAKAEALYLVRFLFGNGRDKQEFAHCLNKVVGVSLFSALCLVLIVLVHTWSHEW